MQAVILAAGMGRRLGALTQNKTKCMVTLHGQTLLERSLEALVEVGVDRIVLVVGYERRGVREAIGDEFRGVPVVYVKNRAYDTTNNIYSLYRARKEFAADDTLLLESDLIYDPQILRQLVEEPAPNVAVVDRHEAWMDGTVVTLTEDRRIEQFVAKAHMDRTRMGEYFKTVNIYKFSQEFITGRYLPFLKAYVKSVGSNEYYEEVLRVIAGIDRQGLVAMPLAGQLWYEIDDVQDYQIAETLFAAHDEQYSYFLSRHGGYWRFPGLKDFCYLVNPYFPTPTMVEEMERSFPTLLSEYPSSLGVQNHLAGKMFGCSADSILVGNGAAELITALGRALDLGTVGVSTPTFEEYLKRFPGAEILTEAADLSGAPRGFDRDRYERLLERAEAVVLVNPDNPSGQCLGTDDIVHLARRAGELDRILILDESFVDFADPEVCRSFLTADDLAEFPNLVVIKSISKSYGVPGARLGVLATQNEDLLARIRAELSVWNVNSFGEYFLQIMGKYEKDYAFAGEQIRAERTRFVEALTRLDGLRVLPSQANYVLCEVTSAWSAGKLASRLLTDHRILVKDCTGKVGFPEGDYLRFAVRDQGDNDALVAALTTLLSEVPS